jgi:hypothetical protein
MATYVLVPGFWLGAWAWQPVAKQLRAAGHEVYAISLTGLGEHASGTDLETHITDIVNLMPPEGRSFIRERVEGQVGWRLPLPSWEELSNISGASLEGLGDKQSKLMRARAADQPSPRRPSRCG